MADGFNRKIVLENGDEYLGYGFGAKAERVCEVVFNTSIVGYQEIVSDSSYTNQMVVMTYPLIGNYGTADDDFESKTPLIGALVVREYNDQPSNFRYTHTLSEILEESDIPAIAGLDTRKLARYIRDNGTCRALITDVETSKEDALKKIAETPVCENPVEQVSCRKRWYSRTSNHKFTVVAVDCGIKLSTIRGLNARGCNVTVVPWNTSADEIRAMKPDGIFISNGPGNPENVKPVIELVRELRGEKPIFGLGLGNHLISLAYGAKIGRLKFGHHGTNHPVRNLETGKIEMTAQNHLYAVDAASVEGTGLTVTHVNVLDNTVEGVERVSDKLFAVQFHPDSAPELMDKGYLFDKFIRYMKEAK